MTITVRTTNAYGNLRIYPVCNKAIWFTKLTGTQTLTADAINSIKALGYTIEVQQKTI